MIRSCTLTPTPHYKFTPQVDFTKDIVLECSDGVACVVPKDLSKRCGVLEKLMSQEEVCLSPIPASKTPTERHHTPTVPTPATAPQSEVKVPLTEITSDIVKRIFLFLEQNKEWPPASLEKIERPLGHDLKTFLEPHNVTYYETQLLNDNNPKDNNNVFLVLKAAQYLSCEPLTVFASASLANIVRGVKGENDFYRMFDIEKPFTPEEKLQVCFGEFDCCSDTSVRTNGQQPPHHHSCTRTTSTGTTTRSKTECVIRCRQVKQNRCVRTNGGKWRS